MASKKRPPAHLTAFISHSSHEAALAEHVEQVLEARGLQVWLDRSGIRPGHLLRAELHESIRKSRALILLWSKAAAKSRWVAAEILTAFHLGRFIIACACDKAPLPYFLQSTIYVNLQPRKMDWSEQLHRAILNAPDAANKVLPKMASRTPTLADTITVLAQGQLAVTDCLEKNDLKGAKEHQTVLDSKMNAAEKQWRMESAILNLAGYHRKNAYMMKHWAAIQAGRPPKDALLQRSERCFFEALFLDPYDFEALNGLGSILILERDLDAAEFFIRRALFLAKQAGVNYPAAQQDLRLVMAFKGSDRGR